MFFKKEKRNNLKKIYKKIVIFFMGLTTTSSLSLFSKNKENHDNELIKMLKKEKKFVKADYDHGVICN